MGCTADLTGRDQLRHGTHRFFDRHLRAAPVAVVEVDLLDAQALQRGLAGALDIGRAIIDTPLIFAGLADDAEFGGNHHLLPARKTTLPEEAAKQAFVVTEAVGIGAIEKVDAEFKSAFNGTYRFRVVGWTPAD